MMKTHIQRIFAVVLLVAILSGYLVLPQKKASAWGFNFDTIIGNVYDIAKDVGIAAGYRIAINYSNQYLMRFTNQLLDKYKIRNYLLYTRVLTDYYVTDYIRNKIADPDLRAIFTLLDATYVQGQTVASGTGITPRKALIPQLKKKIVDYYIQNGGTNPDFVKSPPAGTSDENYYAGVYGYYLNNPNFLEIALAGQLGEIKAAASQAATQETDAGNGYKSSRSSFPKVSASDVIGAIENPGAFVQEFSNEGIRTLFENNLHVDPYKLSSQIGSLLGNFIFNKLNLNASGGVLSEYSNQYQSGGSIINPNDIDVDGDRIPDGVDNNDDRVLDSCYHGGTAPNCINSSVATSSPYFAPLCASLSQAIKQLTSYNDFINTYSSAFSDNTHLRNKADADIWVRKSSIALNAV
ncbi:MAG: hypothetical protein KW788_04020, partial [Candidatus Doudnabacteria bacterium]|nr:hypothetical protein [Candidatus Doudnabacteria bacterium]